MNISNVKVGPEIDVQYLQKLVDSDRMLVYTMPDAINSIPCLSDCIGIVDSVELLEDGEIQVVWGTLATPKAYDIQILCDDFPEGVNVIPSVSNDKITHFTIDKSF